ncbi:MAG: hypothetical protein AAB568_04445 [Patescibacteria group bacterium]
MKTKALINLTVAAFVFLNVMSVALVNNAAKQEPTYIVVDACGKVHVVKGTPKPSDKDAWKWDYTRVCSWAKDNANRYRP